jgi:hypothetical protein
MIRTSPQCKKPASGLWQEVAISRRWGRTGCACGRDRSDPPCHRPPPAPAWPAVWVRPASAPQAAESPPLVLAQALVQRAAVRSAAVLPVSTRRRWGPVTAPSAAMPVPPEWPAAESEQAWAWLRQVWASVWLSLRPAWRLQQVLARMAVSLLERALLRLWAARLLLQWWPLWAWRAQPFSRRVCWRAWPRQLWPVLFWRPAWL